MAKISNRFNNYISSLEKVCCEDGLSTGLESLDKLFPGGLKPGSLTFIGALPGHGSSQLMHQIIDSVAIDQKLAVAVFSSTNSSAFINSFLGHKAKVFPPMIPWNQLSKEETNRVELAADAYNAASFKIFSFNGDRPEDAAKDLKTHKNGAELSLIVFDCLNYFEATQSMEPLKKMATSLQVPILARYRPEVEPPIVPRYGPPYPDLYGALLRFADHVLWINRIEHDDPDTEHSEAVISALSRKSLLSDWITTTLSFDGSRFL